MAHKRLDVEFRYAHFLGRIVRCADGVRKGTDPPDVTASGRSFCMFKLQVSPVLHSRLEGSQR